MGAHYDYLYREAFTRADHKNQIIAMGYFRFFAAFFLVIMISVVMAILGSWLMAHLYPNSLFGKYDLILPSILTWMPLGLLLSKPAPRRWIKVGLISPFIGSMWVVLLRIGPASQIVSHDPVTFVLGGMYWAFSFVLVYSPITLPIGLVTGYMVDLTWRASNLGEGHPSET
jgi:hypothetical protein